MEENENKGLPENLLNKILEFTNNGQQGGFYLATIDEAGSIAINCKMMSEVVDLALREHLEDFFSKKAVKAEPKKQTRDHKGIPEDILKKIWDYNPSNQKGYMMVYVNQDGVPRIVYEASTLAIKQGLKRSLKKFLERIELAESAPFLSGHEEGTE